MMNLKKLLLGSAVAVALVGCSATNQTSTQPSTKEDVQKKTDTNLEKTTTESADKDKK